jgi:hypothetical protein
VSAGARPNIITIHGRDYVLAWVGAYAAHLVAQAGPGAPCRPILAHAGAVLNPRYEPGPLTDAAWSPRTLCGRDEWFMCPTEAGRAFESMWNGREEAVLAPTCKACLRILDREFAKPVPDERLAWNVIRAVEELEQWGSVHIHGVPAEQAELLRTSVRAQARKRGWKFQSMAADGQLIASCENALSPERREFVIRDSMQRMRVRGSGQPPEPSWRGGVRSPV